MSDKRLIDLLRDIIDRPQLLYTATWSVAVEKGGVLKARLKPIVVQQKLLFSLETFTKTQSFTKNMPLDGAFELFLDLNKQFKALFIRFDSAEFSIEFCPNKVVIHKKNVVAQLPDLSHNRVKKHLLQEGTAYDFLVALGIQKADGTIRRDKYDKFKQVVHFLELLTPVFERCKSKDTIKILDLACGKAYLSFALYYFLTSRGQKVELYGVDIREDVIATCRALKERLGYSGMHFDAVSIQSTTLDAADIVVSLHACDVATDYVLAKAIKMGAEAIVVAPCCQHEASVQIDKQAFALMCSHGVLKERFCALLTDALRAEIIKQYGYSVELLEFIDPEHTPKNLLIRAVKKDVSFQPDLSVYNEVSKKYGLVPALQRLLG